MENRRSEDRKKTDMKLIEDASTRIVTFSKRKSEIVKKANELSILCGAEVVVVLFSHEGKPYTFASPRISTVLHKFVYGPPPSSDLPDFTKVCENYKIDQLVIEYNKLLAEFNVVNQRAETLKSAKESRQSKGWWEANVDGVTLLDLGRRTGLIEEFQDVIRHHVEKLDNRRANSSSVINQN